MQNRRTIRIKVDGQWYFLYTLVLLLVPLPWVFGWLFAALLHETGHIAALKFFRIRIFEIKIGIFGVQIKTDSIGLLEEAVCALSGPMFGLSIFCFYDFAPYVAFSALIQSCYNLIPVYPMDGGRALRCLMLQCFSDKVSQKVLSCTAVTIIVAFVLLGIWMSVTYSLGMIPIIFPSMPIALTAMKNTLQTKKKNSTIWRRIVLKGK